MSSAERTIAVAFVHGVMVSDPDFHIVPATLLKEAFLKSFLEDRPDPDRALRVEPVHWAPVLERKQDKLFDLLANTAQRRAVTDYKSLIRDLNRGKLSALPTLGAMFGKRWNTADLHWMALRWLVVHFVGDALAYPSSPATRANYDAVQDIFGEALRSLSQKAHPEAPLAVIAHSLGSVITSDFFYDMQKKKRSSDGTPLERGETLFAFHSLGSPMALWSLRADEAGMWRPIQVPSPQLNQHHPVLSGGWYNYYDPDDVIASPLRDLGAYRDAVAEDRVVHVGGPVSGATPLAHPFYWTNPQLMQVIGYRLAEAYVALHPNRSFVLATPPWERRSWVERARALLPPLKIAWKPAFS